MAPVEYERQALLKRMPRAPEFDLEELRLTGSEVWDTRHQAYRDATIEWMGQAMKFLLENHK